MDAFTMFIAENEGWTDTRLGKLNKMRTMLENGCDYESSAFYADVDVNSITHDELEYLGLK